MRSASALPSVQIDRRGSRGRGRPERSHEAAPLRATAIGRALGALGLLGVVATVFLTSAGAAGEPSQYVPGRIGGWPGWLAGPFEGLHMSIDSSSFQTFTLIMCASYLVVLLAARTLPMAALVAAI